MQESGIKVDVNQIIGHQTGSLRKERKDIGRGMRRNFSNEVENII